MAISYVKHELPEKQLIKDAIDSIWETKQISNFGKYANLLENKACEYIGNKFCLCVSNCDIALKLCVNALGMSGKKVALPTYTFVSTYMAAEWNNCDIHLLDINKETLLVDLQKIEECVVQKGIRDFLLVNVFGNLYNIDDLNYLKNKYDLNIFFDSAHSFGSSLNGVKSGNFGYTECFSFSPTKVITSGEGGIISCHNEEIYKKLILMRKHGFLKDYNTVMKSVNAKIPEISCAILYYSIGIIDELLKKKHKIVNKYKNNLNYSFQKIDDGVFSVFKDFILLGIESENIKKIISVFQKEGIEYKKYFYPLHFQKYILENNPNLGIYDNANYVYDSSICIPSHTLLTDEETDKILEILRSI